MRTALRRPASLLSCGLVSVLLLLGCSAGDDPLGGGVVGDSGSGDGSSGGSFGSGGAGDVLGSGGTTSVVTNPLEQCLSDYMIEDFEDSASYSLFRFYNDGSAGASMNLSSALLPEVDPTSGSNGLHLSGNGYTVWGAGTARVLDAPTECLPRATGLRFKARGSGELTVVLPVRAVVPPEEGGDCLAGDDCNNGHEATIALTSSWQTFELVWNDFKQLPGWGLPATFDIRSVMEVQFAARADNQPFDFWVDDVQLVDNAEPIVVEEPGTGGSSSGSGGSTGATGGSSNTSDCVLDKYMSEAQFNSWFPNRLSNYTYANLCAALEKYPSFANVGDETYNKREVAAFFANVKHESGALQYVEQINKSDNYCDTSKSYGCPAGTYQYFGRGPIQISWNYNYYLASQNLYGDDRLLKTPTLVISDGVITWLAGLWFWMQTDNAKGTPHGAITGGWGFGRTIDIINGGQECGASPPNTTGEGLRIQYYQDFCSKLGVDPGTGLQC